MTSIDLVDWYVLDLTSHFHFLFSLFWNSGLRRKLPATEAIKFNGQPCITPDSLWGALHNTFNHAINRQVDVDILNEIENKSTSSWEPFSKFEFRNAISKCNNLSAPGPDKFTWRHLKHVLKQEECLLNIINIANTCINLGHWPNYFKCSLMFSSIH